MAPILTEKQKNQQIKREALISLGLYVLFFIWWYFTGYGIAEKGTPETYTYVMGLPLWFFLSCIVGYILFSIATIIVVKLCFKNFDLGDEEKEQVE
ncbi:putative membrane protein YhdT [Clostridiales Family XIII bacterium PM5-7]